MAGNPLSIRSAARPDENFIPPHVNPLSLRTALRFAKHLLAGIAFLGGIFLLLALLLGAGAVVLMVWEPMPLGAAVYLVLITALTIGYGDVVPQTALGSFLAPVIGLVGMLMTGVVIAVAVRALDFTVREELVRQQALEPTPLQESP